MITKVDILVGTIISHALEDPSIEMMRNAEPIGMVPLAMGMAPMIVRNISTGERNNTIRQERMISVLINS